MQKHFVNLLYAGIIVSEKSSHEVSDWNISEVYEIIRSQKYKPYGFEFITRERKDNELDSRIIKSSGTYYLGGTVLNSEQVMARRDFNTRILLSNMETNSWEYVIETVNGQFFPFEENDILLPEKV